ncbi:major facilitator superfamily protein [Striga asiatica]|uniref:Major facilitator superfamily protein n=1 Tax=Striga asiatica TaxID=4170 RepID=A0A5A7QXB5_STRAF|nr:major facilitator superfamily protein [Striga asiatica]
MEATQKNTVVEKDEEPEINYRGIKAMPYIIGNETFEKLGALGLLFNLQIYLTTVFNMSRINATNLLNVFNGTTNLATLVGAFLSDTFFGRYKTLGFGSIASTLSMGAVVESVVEALVEMVVPNIVHNGATAAAGASNQSGIGAGPAGCSRMIFYLEIDVNRRKITFFFALAIDLFSSIPLQGLAVITLTAAFKNLHPPHCGPDDVHCVGPTPGQTGFLLSGFGLLLLGASAIRPCNLAFGADQFNPGTESGKRGIDSFFNWYFFTLTFAQMVAVTLVVYVQSDVSWAVGLGIPAGFMFVSCFFFFVGTNIYVVVPPEGSPFTSVARVAVAAARKRRLRAPRQPWLSLFNYVPAGAKLINSRLPYTDQFRFLDKAAIQMSDDLINPDGSPNDPWRLCTMQQVEEVKCLVRVLPIWAATIIYHVGEKQPYVVFQAMQSDRRLSPTTSFRIPPATYTVFSMLTLILFVPLYDRVLVHYLRRLTKKPAGITVLQRMGIGIGLTVIQSLVSAFVEARRRSLAISSPLQFSNRGSVSSASAMWLVPQLSLAGLAEAFCAIGQVEFYYKQFPENMRSVAGSFFFCGLAAADYLKGLLISAVHRETEGSPGGNWLPEDLNKGRLDYFYYLVTGLCALNLGYFLVCAKWYVYKGTSVGVVGVEMGEGSGNVGNKSIYLCECEREGKMKKNERENMEIEAKTAAPDDDDDPPQINYNYRGLKTMPFIIGNETFEKLGAIGTQYNLQLYLTTVFNMSRISSTILLNVFTGTTNIATLAGAFLSDTYFGRYNTLAFASLASLFGMLVVNLTAVFKNLHPPHCDPTRGPCVGPNAPQMAFLIFGFGLMVIGAGGIRPCNLAFGADQFDPNTESGKRGIDSFFNWYYFTVTFATMVSVTLVVYVQSSVSWSVGLALPTIFMFLACFMFFVGARLYVKVRPEGSPFMSLARVGVAAFRKRKLELPPQPWLCLFDYVPPNFLDKAAIKTPEDSTNPNGSPADPWSLCTMQQVEEAKCVARVIPISLTSILYHVGVMPQYLVFQALQSDRHVGPTRFQIPAASYGIFAMLALALWVPLYDRLLVPSLRRATDNRVVITTLQRIGVGIVLTIVESVIGGAVEARRRARALRSATLVSPMSSMWLVPQLVLAGLAEAFNAIGQLEFYYKELPENMRGFAGAVFFCNAAISNYAYGLLITVVHRVTEGSSGGNWLPEDLNKGRLDYFYYLVAVLCAFNFGYFLVCARWYKYKGEGNNAIERLKARYNTAFKNNGLVHGLSNHNVLNHWLYEIVSKIYHLLKQCTAKSRASGNRITNKSGTLMKGITYCINIDF